MRTILGTLVILGSLLLVSCGQAWKKPVHTSAKEVKLSQDSFSLSDIRIRDPYILADKATRTYYLYAQTANRDEFAEKGVEVYTSTDLEIWSGPETVFTFPKRFWANNEVWAPEVHIYRDRYYLFVTLSSSDTLETPQPYANKKWPEQVKRGTQILVADSPEGPFLPFDNKPHTPVEWSALDGTLYVEDDIPYMVFCHEWTQIGDGSMEVVQLAEDLSEPVKEPLTLFHAGVASWVTPVLEHGKITDGCFLHTTKDGKLIMIWSSVGENGYAIGQAVSQSGLIVGPWEQAGLIFEENGGHGMIFETFEGELMLAFHQPNISPQERAQLFRVVEENGLLVISVAL